MFGRRWGKEAGKTKGAFKSLRAGKTSISFLIIYRPDLWQRISSTSVRIETHPFSPFLNEHQDFKCMFSADFNFSAVISFSVESEIEEDFCFWGFSFYHLVGGKSFSVMKFVSTFHPRSRMRKMVLCAEYEITVENFKYKGNPLFLFLWTNWIRPISPFPLYFWTIIYSLHKWVFLIIWQSNCLYWIINTPPPKKKRRKITSWNNYAPRYDIDFPGAVSLASGFHVILFIN